MLEYVPRSLDELVVRVCRADDIDPVLHAGLVEEVRERAEAAYRRAGLLPPKPWGGPWPSAAQQRRKHRFRSTRPRPRPDPW